MFRKFYLIPLLGLFFIFNLAFAANLPGDIPSSFSQKNFINQVIQNKVFKLDQHGNFFPNQKINKVSFIKAAFTDAGITPPHTLLDSPFKDIPVNSWFSPYIKKALDIKAISLTPNYYFHPGNTLSRQKALTIALAIFGIPINTQTPTPHTLFKDIRPNQTDSSYFQTAYLLGINFNQNPTLFQPSKLLTKADAAELLTKVKDVAKSHGFFIPGTVSVSSNSPAILVSPTITPTEQQLLQSPDFSVFLNVWDRIHNQYLNSKTLNESTIIQNAIAGMVNGLGDPHSEYRQPGNNGTNFIYLPDKYDGIGAVIEKVNTHYIIQTTINNSPAFRAGLQTGDVIYQIEGHGVNDLNNNNITNLIKGPTGTTLHLQIKRNGQILSFNIIRETIDIASVHYKTISSNINYLRIDQFTENSGKEFELILPKILKNGSKKLIIDLRNNPGGYLTSTQTILNHILYKNQTDFYTENASGTEIPYTSKGPGELHNYKIAVLINKGSASAAEIMTGALQDLKLAKIFGTISYGKGTIQQIVDYGNNTTLKLTIAQWLTPDLHSINNVGITPDYIVNITKTQKANSQDPQLNAAINYMNSY